MTQSNISGEILVHQLNTNQKDVIIMLPKDIKLQALWQLVILKLPLD